MKIELLKRLRKMSGCLIKEVSLIQKTSGLDLEGLKKQFAGYEINISKYPDNRTLFNLFLDGDDDGSSVIDKLLSIDNLDSYRLSVSVRTTSIIKGFEARTKDDKYYHYFIELL